MNICPECGGIGTHYPTCPREAARAAAYKAEVERIRAKHAEQYGPSTWTEGERKARFLIARIVGEVVGVTPDPSTLSAAAVEILLDYGTEQWQEGIGQAQEAQA